MKHNRHSIRLRNYDYSIQGLYFVTLCTKDREIYFNRDNIKEMIKNVWLELKNKYPNIDLDEFVIMPNHIHGIVIIEGEHIGSPLRSRDIGPALGQTIQWFKTMTTNYYIQGINAKNWPRFNQKLWQRNYYEHIIRNQKSLEEIRKYIRLNPHIWDRDRNNPKNIHNS